MCFLDTLTRGRRKRREGYPQYVRVGDRLGQMVVDVRPCIRNAEKKSNFYTASEVPSEKRAGRAFDKTRVHRGANTMNGSESEIYQGPDTCCEC